MTAPERRQQLLDRFYTDHGPCCAGCDQWHHVNNLVGECHKAAPVSGEQRFAMIGVESPSIAVGAGHPMMPRSHHCGDFRDNFNWSNLPSDYLRSIGRRATGAQP